MSQHKIIREPKIDNKMKMRGALLLSVALILQELRLVLPLPTLASVFIIGTLLNAALVVATRFSGLFAALAIATALPIVAYLQGHLLLPLLIPIVALGNCLFVIICDKFWGKGIFIIAPLLKTFVLYSASLFLLSQFGIPTTMANVILFGMGWPQLVTGIVGILLAVKLEKRLHTVKI
ncbi:MAG: hypothetical protein RSE47_07570 [Acidaminococcaceae bacterium]